MEPDSAVTLAFEQIPLCSNPSFFPKDPTLGPGIVQDGQNFVMDPLPDEKLSAFLEQDDPLSDPVIRAFCNGTDEDVTFDGSGNGIGLPGDDNLNLMLVNPVPGYNSGGVPIVSVPQSQYNCICCQRLRVITHTNGMNVKRLEIHGNFGEISHAVLEIYSFDSSSSQCQETQMFHFQESMETVKKFLLEYFEACKQEGYRTLQDPLLSFYQALAIGSDEHRLQPPTNSGQSAEIQCTNHQQEITCFEGGSNLGEMLMKIPLSTQRERTRNLKLKDLVDYFNLPIGDAAKKLNICPTVMKKICRRHGMLRWPYRKIKSLDRKISNKVSILESSNGQERTQLLEDIQKYQKELLNIYQTFTN